MGAMERALCSFGVAQNGGRFNFHSTEIDEELAGRHKHGEFALQHDRTSLKMKGIALLS